MPCGVTANLIEVLGDGSVRVSGVFTGSQAFNVGVTDLTVSKRAILDAPNWTVAFSGTEITGNLTLFRRRRCGGFGNYAIRRPPFGGGELPPCQGTDSAPVQCECPQTNITITPGDCDAGQRTVHFRAEVASADDATYIWFFGTDEDNQPGEDSQAGDGAGNIWLPGPDSNGIRVVEDDHVYAATAGQPQTITVKLVTSTGPDAECVDEQQFSLEPCLCNLTVSLQVLNTQGDPIPTSECLAPGDYAVEITSPTGNNIEYSWSVNGIADNSQNDPTFSFSIAAGEEKTITVFVELGECDGSNGVTVRGCGGGRGPDRGGTECIGCTILRILALALLILGLVAIIGGACSQNAIAIGAGVGAALLGAALLVMWALFCAPTAGCLALQRVIGLVNLLLTVVALIAVLFAVLGLLGIVVGWPCLSGALADGGILILLQLALWQIFLAQGCQWQGRSIYR